MFGLVVDSRVGPGTGRAEIANGRRKRLLTYLKLIPTATKIFRGDAAIASDTVFPQPVPVPLALSVVASRPLH